MDELCKYPRTRHIEGSGLQRGDEDMAVVPFRALSGRHLVVEEKMDGANCAVSFDERGQLLLQSRGHFLVGGAREQQFHLFKTWAHAHAPQLWGLLGKRYVLFGEWVYAKHSVFYTALPHYFMEFDIHDREAGCFLSTERRRSLLARAPFVVSVRVLHEGRVATVDHLRAMVGPSAFIGDDRLDRLRLACRRRGLDVARVLGETDASGLMEGLYVKDEEEGVVKGRYKYVRDSFLQAVFDAQSHWLDRPVLPNELQADAALFSSF